MGFVPQVYQPIQESIIPTIEECHLKLCEAWDQALKSIAHAQSLWQKSIKFHPYQQGDRVWLEGTNLHTSHPTDKLCLKRFGLFEIIEVLSAVTY
jgi:hypothetical protein